MNQHYIQLAKRRTDVEKQTEEREDSLTKSDRSWQRRKLITSFTPTLRRPLQAPSDLEKLQRGTTTGRSALQMSHRTNPLFNLSAPSCRGGHFTAASLHCLSFLCFIETDRETEGGWIGDGGAYTNPFYSQMGKSWRQDLWLLYSQQGDFSPHVRITCRSQKIKGGLWNCGKVSWRVLSASSPSQLCACIKSNVVTNACRIWTGLKLTQLMTRNRMNLVQFNFFDTCDGKRVQLNTYSKRLELHITFKQANVM